MAGDTKSKKTDKVHLAVLGVAIGEDRYLVPMAEVSEVIAIPKLVQVPLTQPWFAGLANVRGHLYGITDLSIYLCGKPMPHNVKSRILLVSLDSKIYGGFIVSHMLGIRNLSEFGLNKTPQKKIIPGVIGRYSDQEGRIWQKLSLIELLRDDLIFQVACE